MTTGAYSLEHSSALADVRAAGAPAVFTAAAGTYDEATDRTVPAASTSISGYAIEKQPSLSQYAALNLVIARSKTLFFVPETYGELPAIGSKITWVDGNTFSVKAVLPLAPDGVAIAGDIVVSR